MKKGSGALGKCVSSTRVHKKKKKKKKWLALGKSVAFKLLLEGIYFKNQKILILKMNQILLWIIMGCLCIWNMKFVQQVWSNYSMSTAFSPWTLHPFPVNMI